MKASLFAFGVLALLAPCASGLSSGIFAGDGKTIIQPPSYDKSNLQKGDAPPTPTRVERITNAERLRRRLPLLPPAAKRSNALAPRASADRALLPRASFARRAPLPRASCTALPNSIGRLRIHRSDDDSFLGYVGGIWDEQNSYTYSTIADALRVQLSPSSGDGPLEIIAIDGGPDPAYPYLGAVGGSAGYNFNAKQMGYAYLAGTGHTPANSPPSFNAGHSIQALGYQGPAESTVWSLDCLSLQVTPQWTNADGSQPPTSVFFDAEGGWLALVGDFGEFTTTFPNEGAFLVDIRFEPEVSL
ncbi:hypothetical protein D9611_009875 [Ephemerocybe angulata]|uniref:Uncharacterized protein n=1 Tax=Ephemerocybe angulata TaxID=980116 RepID=A0A8H5CCK5_9AGAR|nr:hypothetical protein D9611_009875 [Tulosesus angulatus]